MIDFLARYEAHILYAYLPIEIMAVIAFLVYCKFVVWLFKAFKRSENDHGKKVVSIFRVLPVNLLKSGRRNKGRRAQHRKIRELVELAYGEMGERLADLDSALFDVVAPMDFNADRSGGLSDCVSYWL